MKSLLSESVVLFNTEEYSNRSVRLSVTREDAEFVRWAVICLLLYLVQLKLSTFSGLLTDNEMEPVAYYTNKSDKSTWEQEENGASQTGNTVNIPEDMVKNCHYFQQSHTSKIKYCKDAGVVYESLRIETNRVIWDFCFHEMNPLNESFKNRPTNRIHDTNP